MLDQAFQHRARRWLPRLALAGTIAAILVITLLSLLPGSDVPGVHWSDKISHLVAYTALAGAAIVARRSLGAWQVILLVVAYGLVIEVAQGLMPYGREASFLDAIANTAGALVGAAAGLAIERLFALRHVE